jgi:hypothetical protein
MSNNSITSFFVPLSGAAPREARPGPTNNSSTNGITLRRAHVAKVTRARTELFPRADEEVFDGASAAEQDRVLDAAQATIHLKRRQSKRQQEMRERKAEQALSLMKEMNAAQLLARAPPAEGSTPSQARREARRLANSPWSSSRSIIDTASPLL